MTRRTLSPDAHMPSFNSSSVVLDAKKRNTVKRGDSNIRIDTTSSESPDRFIDTLVQNPPSVKKTLRKMLNKKVENPVVNLSHLEVSTRSSQKRKIFSPREAVDYQAQLMMSHEIW